MKKIFSLLIFVILAASISFWYFSVSQRKYSLSGYFPLNENDKYIYTHREGAEEGVLSITVKNVKKTAKGKQFDFLWEGKYNDRLQTLLLTSRGIELCKNVHLVGQVPMKVIRIATPPLLMIPSNLKRNNVSFSMQPAYTYEGKLLYTEKVEVEISFVGIEEVTVEAGKFKCIHFFARHNYKDEVGNSKHMHTYDFWIAPNVGFVKFVHTFVPFMYIRYIKPNEKTIMNRYHCFFVEVILELKKAIIGVNLS